MCFFKQIKKWVGFHYWFELFSEVFSFKDFTITNIGVAVKSEEMFVIIVFLLMMMMMMMMMMMILLFLLLSFQFVEF
jgi:hypothetical protein